MSSTQETCVLTRPTTQEISSGMRYMVNSLCYQYDAKKKACESEWEFNWLGVSDVKI